jgi:hypothetical protein
MVWNKTYFGITRSNAAPLADILGADWSEGDHEGRSKTPDHVEFLFLFWRSAFGDRPSAKATATAKPKPDADFADVTRITHTEE